MRVYEFLCKHQKKLFWIILSAGALFLIWKAQYGYIFNDEPFIVSLGHRMAKGDRLFVHEWNITQLFSFFMLPLVKLYTAIAGSTTGLLLFVRYVYVAWWVLASGLLYVRFRQYGAIGLFAMLYFLLFTPLDMMSVTYNAVSLSCLALFGSYFLIEGNRPLDVLHGIVLALGVLASPYCIFMYLIWVAAALIVRTTSLQKKSFARARVFDLKKLLFITIGAAAVAALFGGYLLWIGLDRVVGYFDHMLINHTAAPLKDLLNLCKALLRAIPAQIILGIPLLLVSAIDKKRHNRRLLYFALQTALWCLSMGFILLKMKTLLNVMMLPLTLLGLQAFILTEKKDVNAFCALWITGLLFAGCSAASSDTGYMIISMATTVSGLGSILHIYGLAQELDYGMPRVRQWVTLGFALIICVQLGTQTATRVARTYWDAWLPELDTRITQGVAWGVITTEEHVRQYDAICSDLQIIREQANAEDLLLTPSLLPWIYLELDMEYATNSTWTYISNQTNHELFFTRLEEYYQENPEKVPQYIYVENRDLECLEDLDRVVDLTRYQRIEGCAGLIFRELRPR